MEDRDDAVFFTMGRINRRRGSTKGPTLWFCDFTVPQVSCRVERRQRVSAAQIYIFSARIFLVFGPRDPFWGPGPRFGPGPEIGTQS